MTTVNDRNSRLNTVIPSVLPSTPVYSSRELGWNGLLVERCQYSGGEYRIAPLPVHSIALHLGRPIQMGQKRGGKTHQDLFPTHHFVVVPAGLPNMCWHTDAADELFINLDPQLVAKTAETIGIDPSQIEVINNFGRYDSQLQHIGLSLLQELRLPGLGGRLYIESLTVQLVIHLLRYHTASGHFLPEPAAHRLSHARLQQTLAFIRDQLDQDLSLADMAALVHLSPYHFARIFKQSIGLSPHQYVIAQRVESAKRLLANRDLSVTQVASEVGFADYSHLTRHFKRLVGVSPKEFQLRNNVHMNSKIVQDSSARVLYNVY